MLSVYHMAAFTIGFVMDLLFGDPYWLPHPIRWIGRLIGWLDRKLLGETDGAVRDEAAERKKGRWLVAFVLLLVFFFAAVVLFAAYRDPSGGGDHCREHYDLPDACHEVLKDGEHEGVQAAFGT